MNKTRTVSILVVLALLTINLIASVQPASACLQGCTPGYWKQAQHFENWTGYTQLNLVVLVFTEADGLVGPDDTLLDALNYGGGKGAEGAARILLRAATATLLNSTYDAAHGGGWWYSHWTPDQIASSVNARLAALDRAEMLSLADVFDAFNNLGCPLD
jgi:hypothetical protein